MSPSSHHESVAPSNVFDVVIVGATPAGIVMAVRCAREGLRVLLVHHTRHLGGMLTSGLGVWDTRYTRRRAPLHDEIRQAFFDHYRRVYGVDSPQYRDALPGSTGHTNGKFEPQVAEEILNGLVRAEALITVLLEHYPWAVDRVGRRVEWIKFSHMEGTGSFTAGARVFADCSYEADTLPLAGLAYRVDRESRAQHGEPHAGVVFMEPLEAAPDASASEEARRQAQLNLRQFAGFQRRLPESTGIGDGNVQAMNYRVILSNDPRRSRPIQCPEGYDSAAVEGLDFGAEIEGLPNGKMGLNRPQLIGPHLAYIEGTWAERRRVMDAHWQAAMAILWHRQNDPSVSMEEQARWRAYGLASDEFTDNGNRPYEIYCREGRRLVGRALITQKDTMIAQGLARPPIHADSIAFTEWYVDSHACTTRRLAQSLEEGKMMLYQETYPGQVPLRAILPCDVDNLLVPVNLSATHVAWNTVRLEPTWMHIAEAAAWVAVLALRNNLAPAAIDRGELLRTLAIRGVTLAFFNDVESQPGDELGAAVQYFATMGLLPGYDACLHAPVKTATAKVWVGAVDRGSEDDPNLTARQVLAADNATGLTMDGAAMSAMIPGGTPESAGGRLVTRGEFLLTLWRHAKRSNVSVQIREDSPTCSPLR
ncbi:MAG: FAD-dependent oxidoreductase [Opitutaceae bacterium]|nr:FAD-dependent oxidoreductase [Opitutaceae bacterium]